MHTCVRREDGATALSLITDDTTLAIVSSSQFAGYQSSVKHTIFAAGGWV